MDIENKNDVKINIAIDGPAGAGKSTLARAAAAELGFVYADTGALYRAIALFMMQRDVNVYDAKAVCRSLDLADVELKFVDGEQRVYLCGENVSSAIRTPEVSKGASAVSAIFAVREHLMELQKEIAAKNNCIMDGRDIGTVILPDAQLKIWLTASVEERAERRYKELIAKGIKVDLEDIISDVRQRDYNDANRAIAPMKPAEDSVVLDTTGLGLEGAIDALLELIYLHLPKLSPDYVEPPVLEMPFFTPSLFEQPQAVSADSNTAVLPEEQEPVLEDDF